MSWNDVRGDTQLERIEALGPSIDKICDISELLLTPNDAVLTLRKCS